MVKLGEIGTFVRGGGFLKRDYVDNGFPCIHYGQIHTKLGFTTTQHLTMIPESLVSKSKIASNNDVIIAITSEDVEGSCKSTAWMGNYDVAVGAHAAIFKHSQNPIYISYYFRSPFFNRDKAKYVHGFKVVEIKPSDIAKIEIPLPPLPEQRRLVSLLDAAFEKIDALKANAEQNLINAKALFQQTLAQELKPKEGWKMVKLGEVCEIERGGSPRPIKNYITDSPDGLNWIKIGDTDPQGKYIYSTSEKIKPEGLKRSRWVEENDFLLSNSMSYGRPYILKTNGCIHDGWLVLRNYEKSLDIDFFYYLLLSPIVQRQFSDKAQGSTVSNLNTQRVSSVEVCIPPLPEQQSIVATLDALSEKCRRLEEVAKQTISECDALKQSILRQAFSGEL